jgi:hypothetical protein
LFGIDDIIAVFRQELGNAGNNLENFETIFAATVTKVCGNVEATVYGAEAIGNKPIETDERPALAPLVSDQRDYTFLYVGLGVIALLMFLNIKG